MISSMYRLFSGKSLGNYTLPLLWEMKKVIPHKEMMNNCGRPQLITIKIEIRRKKMDIEDVIVRAAAIAMGKRGGGVRSERQIEAFRKNSAKGGRKRKYSYALNTQAIYGKKTEGICVIPDEVAADPQKYLNKTFAVYCRGERFNGRVWVSATDKTNIHVRRV